VFQKIFVVLIPVLFCSNVFAAQVFQTLAPAVGQSEVTPYLGLAVASGETKGTPKTTVSAGVAGLGLSYYYGVVEGHSIGAEVSYLSQTITASATGFTDIKQKNKGLTNPVLKYKGLFETEAISLFGQLGYKFGIEKEKYNSTDSEGNSADGQNSILLNVGVYAPVNADMTLGGFINYEKANDGEKTITASGIDSTLKTSGGGSTLVAAFFELQSNEYKPNVTLGHLTRNSSESVSGGTTTKVDAKHYLVLSGSARFPIEPNLSINPEIIYQSLLNNDTFDHYVVLAASASLRLLF
jgi:hypothetical protein